MAASQLEVCSQAAVCIRRYALVLWMALAGTVVIAQQLPKGATQEFLFTSAPFASSHASTLVQLKSGQLMAAWFGGTAEGDPDVAIWSSVRTPKGWSAPVEIAREPNTPCWNPVLFYTPVEKVPDKAAGPAAEKDEQRLWLYYKFGPNVWSWTGARRWSTDDGRTWSPIEVLPAGLLGPVRAKPLTEANGHIISGTSIESYQAWSAWIERSTDHGLTWSKYGPIVFPGGGAPPPPSPDGTSGIIQPVVIPFGSKYLRLYARATENIGHIVTTDSIDDGLTWAPTHLLDLPNPNSAIDAVRLTDGRIVLAYNDTAHGRSPLSLAESSDGEHFHNFAVLENAAGEYSYPALIQEKDGSLGVTYTWQRTRIRYAHVPLAAVPNQ